MLMFLSGKSLRSFGDCALSFGTPKRWNELPKDIRNTAWIGNFKNALKTYFFKLAFSH